MKRFTPHFTKLDQEKGLITRFDCDRDGNVIKEHPPIKTNVWWSDKHNRMVNRKEMNK